jgi:hypothetical protein
VLRKLEKTDVLQMALGIKEEIVSPSGRYRATVSLRRDGLFEVAMWKASEEASPGSSRPTSVWLPIGTISIVDGVQRGVIVAAGRLEAVSHEPIDATPDPITIEWIREYSGDPEAQFVDPQMFTVQSERGPIGVKRLLRVGGYYLIEDNENPPDWWMGSQADEESVVVCWGTYGTLANAIDSL